MIPYPDRSLVTRLLDVVIPADSQPGATEAGVLGWLDGVAADHHAEHWRTLFTPGLDALAAELAAGAELDAELVAELGDQDRRPGWTVSPRVFVATLADVAAHGYYGRRESGSWSGIGYDPAPKLPVPELVRHVAPTESGVEALDGSYDVVVVGAGAGGGVAARVLTEAGARVLLLDRGRFLTTEAIGHDHLANHRFSGYGHNTGPERTGNPRVVADSDGEHRIDAPHHFQWQNNAMTVGGGTRVYQGMAWRFQPDDFRMASRYGVPEGSSLADWPLTYDELEPFYTRVEQEFGVCGDGSAHRFQGRRSAPYPMPPQPETVEAGVLRKGAEALGLSTGPVPLLINTQQRDGRAACVRCGQCIGFGCPVDARAGSHNTVIPLALATGLCRLVPGQFVERVLVDHTGRATGVVVDDLRTGARREIRAGAVVLAAGAIETARLLLASSTPEFPDGLGNRSGHVGRHLQGHNYVGAFGLFDDPVQDLHGPGVSIATTEYTHDLDGEGIGGGVIANEVVKMPALFRVWAIAPDAPRWGHAAKQWMRDAYLRTAHLMGPIQEIPNPQARVTLADDVRDAIGQRVARLSGAQHPESVRAAHALRRRAERWMHASGARQVWTGPVQTGLTGGQHQAGTARMGTDPAHSVTDPYGRVHGHAGLWISDASLHVTNGGVNPVLTILALAYRCIGELAATGAGRR
ncbi:GMC oxidoreductase [Pseudonocardia nematodicida]|uniref:GMC oxidoreductase n=1 Tax=Pseudonocardia nematodicida TaxID=1206997 RepID=A0ABV1KH19_9PSEU